MIGDRWGVSEMEIFRSYPCDSFVASPELQAWRGVRVEVPPEAVWSWVAQVRLAPYSYDWIDNLGRRSPQELVGLPEPEVGEPFTTAGGLSRIQNELTSDPGVTESFVDVISGTVHVGVFAATQSRQRELDAKYGPGLITLSGKLEPIDL